MKSFQHILHPFARSWIFFFLPLCVDLNRPIVGKYHTHASAMWVLRISRILYQYYSMYIHCVLEALTRTSPTSLPFTDTPMIGNVCVSVFFITSITRVHPGTNTTTTTTNAATPVIITNKCESGRRCAPQANARTLSTFPHGWISGLSPPACKGPPLRYA